MKTLNHFVPPSRLTEQRNLFSFSLSAKFTTSSLWVIHCFLVFVSPSIIWKSYTRRTHTERERQETLPKVATDTHTHTGSILSFGCDLFDHLGAQHNTTEKLRNNETHTKREREDGGTIICVARL
jgi:hypothetical protein